MPFGSMGMRPGMGNNDEVENLRKKIEELGLPDEAKRIVDQEI